MAVSQTPSFLGETVGLVAMDPGSTTGLLTAILDIQRNKSVAEIFADGDWEAYEINCNDTSLGDRAEVPGAVAIQEIYYLSAIDWAFSEIPPSNHVFVYEKFGLRGTPGSLAREGISPVRVTNTVFGLLADLQRQPTWIGQTPEQAKTRWNADRLRRSGLWIVGSEHKRDAMRHAALFVAKQLT